MQHAAATHLIVVPDGFPGSLGDNALNNCHAPYPVEEEDLVSYSDGGSPGLRLVMNAESKIHHPFQTSQLVVDLPKALGSQCCERRSAGPQGALRDHRVFKMSKNSGCGLPG